MLGSNLSAVTGDGDMGRLQSNVSRPRFHVSVFNALNPCALAQNIYPVGPPEAYVITIPYAPAFLTVPFMNTSAGVFLPNAECFRLQL